MLFDMDWVLIDAREWHYEALSNIILSIRNIIGISITEIPIELWFYTVFIPEKAYYEYFLNNKIQVVKTDISWILLRKNIKKSYVRLEEKTEYEI